ncbi:GAG-pre-integrase domain-containing protein [Penicillium bovifimosum]|uniref:GAG-pre-integrase domain-containing protein n=1 Tax=Penicillium bovifimosum TaxID=126998 RepID=A0A9W9L8P4_9EURO|nr:GAG-pre-integrase domain-containing protein [Penicillium bovifimosum]KAJ5142562.1 GAG-pre-integrase domain-containing protein [Penicillium bovifimosum]
MATGMDANPQECPCIHCLQGKLKRTPHRSSNTRGAHKLEFLHVDIQGPFDVGNDVSRYSVGIVDDFSQRGWAVPIRTRDALSPLLISFLEQHQRPELRCRRIRLDRGGENMG